MKYRILLEQYEDGVYEASCESLPGFISQAPTRTEMLGNIKEAVEGYLESQRQNNETASQPVN